jgi:hypothetical protein
MSGYKTFVGIARKGEKSFYTTSDLGMNTLVRTYTLDYGSLPAVVSDVLDRKKEGFLITFDEVPNFAEGYKFFKMASKPRKFIEGLVGLLERNKG